MFETQWNVNLEWKKNSKTYIENQRRNIIPGNNGYTVCNIRLLSCFSLLSQPDIIFGLHDIQIRTLLNVWYNSGMYNTNWIRSNHWLQPRFVFLTARDINGHDFPSNLLLFVKRSYLYFENAYFYSFLCCFQIIFHSYVFWMQIF